jgi:hypothetical protein
MIIKYHRFNERKHDMKRRKQKEENEMNYKLGVETRDYCLLDGRLLLGENS